jgi:hypothetical protein
MLPSVIGGPGDAACFGAISAESSRSEGERNLPSAKQNERDDERKHRVPDQSSAASFTPPKCGGAFEFLRPTVRGHIAARVDRRRARFWESEQSRRLRRGLPIERILADGPHHDRQLVTEGYTDSSLRQKPLRRCTPCSRMLPSVIGGPWGCVWFIAVGGLRELFRGPLQHAARQPPLRRASHTRTRRAACPSRR